MSHLDAAGMQQPFMVFLVFSAVILRSPIVTYQQHVIRATPLSEYKNLIGIN